MRIGLLGGSFDPIHHGHLTMARYAKKQLSLDEVWFVIAKDAPLKDRKLTLYEHRLAMVEKAIQAYDCFKVCTIENDMEGKSYTIMTIKALKKSYPDDSFYFIMGADQVMQLDKWKDIDELQEIVHLCAFERNKQPIDTPYKVKSLIMPPYDISSSEVRSGSRIHVHESVRQYMYRHGLYYEFLSECMSVKRYAHSLSVANLCVDIAKSHHLDIHKAYMCGLLHDIMKEYRLMDKVSSMAVLKVMRKELLQAPEAIWHGYLGRFVCEHKLYIHDHDILEAIEHHVVGASRNPYAMLLYVSDKLDPGRGYDSSETIALCKKDLYAGFKEVHKQQKQYLEKENVSGIRE